MEKENSSAKGSWSPLEVWKYLDYRKLLRDYMALQKSRDPAFSNHAFCVRAGLPLNNASLVSKAILGKINLTSGLRLKFAQGMRLSPFETRYFDLMVRYNQAASKEEKVHFSAELSRFRTSKVKVLDKTKYQFHDKWFYMVVRGFFGFEHSMKSPRKIGERIFPTLSPEEVEEAIVVLLDLKLIKRTANGYSVSDPHITTGRGVKDMAGKAQMVRMTRMAMEILDSLPTEVREYNCMTMYMSEQCFKDIRESMRAFREEIKSRLDRDTGEDRVYTLTMQLFPNSRWPGFGENK